MSDSEQHAVGLVLHHDFTAGLSALADQMHVWVLDTAENSAESKRIWERHPRMSWRRGVTTFEFEDSESPEEICLRIVPVIDEHHDEHSSPQPYNVLNVVGLSLSVNLKSKLSEFGFKEFEETRTGFRASK